MTEIKNRARFGIQDLDNALDGGLPRGSLVLIEEDTGPNHRSYRASSSQTGCSITSTATSSTWSIRPRRS